MHRVGEALPLPQRPGGAGDVYARPEGQQRDEHVAAVQVETQTSLISCLKSLNIITQYLGDEKCDLMSCDSSEKSSLLALLEALK